MIESKNDCAANSWIPPESIRDGNDKGKSGKKTRKFVILCSKEHSAAVPYQIKAVQTNNGSEFHKYFRDYLQKSKIKHCRNYPGRPYKNNTGRIY